MEQELRRIANEIHQLVRVMELIEKELGKFNKALQPPTIQQMTMDDLD